VDTSIVLFFWLDSLDRQHTFSKQPVSRRPVKNNLSAATRLQKPFSNHSSLYTSLFKHYAARFEQAARLTGLKSFSHHLTVGTRQRRG
jgi:hypothetical protein